MNIFRRIFGKSNNTKPTAQEPQNPIEKSEGGAVGEELSKHLEMEGVTGNDDEMPGNDEGATLDTDPEMLDDYTPLPIVFDSVTRPLSHDIPMPFPERGHLKFSSLTDIGMVRTNNQDACYSFFSTLESSDNRPNFGLFIVADGMGGHHDGEKASAVTVQVVAEEILKHVYLPLLHDHSALNDANSPTISELLMSAIQSANEMVLKQVPEGGTTVTLIMVLGNLIHIGHVGDSRAYIITQDGIEQITRDHSLVQRLIELNQITAEEAENHPKRNILYRALGQNEELEVDTLTRRLQAETSILICSDGLWGLVDNKTMREIITKNDDPATSCEELIALANAKGGHDNVTAVLLQLPS